MSVRKASKHSWSYRVDVGKDPVTGKRRQVYKAGFIFKRAKSDHSIREVVIPDSVISLLKQLELEQKKMKFRMGPAYQSYDIIICTVDGKPIYPRNFSRTFERLRKKSEVKKISLHCLRHTNATILMKQGINPKIVSERLGHANVGITLNVYSHTDLEMQRESALKLEKLLN